MELSLVLTIGGYLLGIGVVYGVLKTKIDILEKQKDVCDKRFCSIEETHSTAIDGIRDEIKTISTTLNQLVGKIDMFFALYSKETGHNE